MSRAVKSCRQTSVTKKSALLIHIATAVRKIVIYDFRDIVTALCMAKKKVVLKLELLEDLGCE